MKFYLILLFSIVSALCPGLVHGQVVSTIAGNGTVGYYGDGGPAVLAAMDTPTSIARDPLGNIYVNDQRNHCVRKIDHATGFITTVAGNGTAGFYGDGGPATNAMLNANWGIAVDGAGNLYIADQTNARIRKVNTAGIITTIAGNGTIGKGGDGGPAVNAQFIRPMGITTDGAGNIYVGDQSAFNIRKISPSGIISTIAGRDTFGYTGDGGPAINAKISYTWSMATDNAGNLFICDGGGNIYGGNNCIRKIDAAGIITTVAGNGVPGYSGDGGPATSAMLNQPTGIYIDQAGAMIIADAQNDRIRKVSPEGIISTICGTGVTGFNGDDLAATSTQLFRPVGVTGDADGNIFFTDMYNTRARSIHKVLYFYKGYSAYMDVCENVSTQIDSILAITDITTGRSDIWTIGTPPAHGSLSGFPFSQVSSGGYNLPMGLAYTPPSLYVGNDSFIINVTNGVDTSFIKVYLAVNPRLVYAGVIEGPSAVCVGAAITLTDTTGNGIWSASNLNAVVANGIVTGQSAGTVTITYTLTNACGSISATKTVTVYALPDPGKISGDSLLCVGETVQLSETVPGGTWAATLWAISITSSGQITAIRTGRDTIKYTVSDGNCSNKAFYTVTIDAVPIAQITTGRPAICVGDTTFVTGIPDGGFWLYSKDKLALSGNIITGIAPGVDTISYVFENHCGIDTASTMLRIYPTPQQPTITQNESVLYIPDSFATYQWLLNKTPLPGARADSYTVNATGRYSVTVTNQFGCPVTSPEAVFSGCAPDDLLFYPNPAESIVHVAWCKPVTIILFSVDGKEIYKVTNTNETNLSGLPNGTYLLVFFDNTGNRIKAGKIVRNSKTQ